MSTITTCVSSSPIIGNLHLPNRQRCHLDRMGNTSLQLPITAVKHKSSFITTYRMRPVSFSPVTCWRLYAAMGPTPPPVPNLPKPNLPLWARCIVGVIVSLLQPFWKLGGGGKLLAFTHQVERTVDIVENVAEIVENVAEAVEKASSEIAKKLPEDGFLHDAVTLFGNISHEVGDDAEDVLKFINKAEEVKEELESIVEDVIEGKCNPAADDKITEQAKDQMKVNLPTEKADKETKDVRMEEDDKLTEQAKDQMKVDLSTEKADKETKDVKMVVDETSLVGKETPDAL